MNVVTPNVQNIPNTPQEKCLISKNPKEKLIKSCSQHFGITKNPCEGGFLLENGDFLDFSGKSEGLTSGVRAYDHRDISFCIDSDSCKNVENFHKFRLMGIHANTIRFHGSGCNSYYPVINIMMYKDQSISDKQWETIRKASQPEGGIVYDIADKNGNTVHTGSIGSKNLGKLRTLFQSLK